MILERRHTSQQLILQNIMEGLIASNEKCVLLIVWWTVPILYKNQISCTEMAYLIFFSNVPSLSVHGIPHTFNQLSGVHCCTAESQRVGPQHHPGHEANTRHITWLWSISIHVCSFFSFFFQFPSPHLPFTTKPIMVLTPLFPFRLLPGWQMYFTSSTWPLCQRGSSTSPCACCPPSWCAACCWAWIYVLVCST